MGCSVAPQRAAVEPELPAQFVGAGKQLAPALWWQAFDDAELDRLVALALAENPSLQAVAARLRAAQAQASGSAAGLFPSLSASRSVSEGFDDQPDDRIHAAGLSAAYEVDLWGRVRAGRDASRLQAQATAQELAAARISLAANVAVLWYQIGSSAERLGRIETEREVYERIGQLVETRYRYGQAPASDVLRQRQLIESTRSLEAATLAELGVRQNALAELLGQPALAAELAGRLPALTTALPATGVPAVAVNRRPDVRGAWLQVQAADRTVAAAVANRFPQLNLSASYSSSGAAGAEFFDSWLGTLMASLGAPLIDGGARRAEVARTQAVLDQRLADYRGAVLGAFREVADALLQDQQLQIRVASLEQQLALSDQVVDRLERQLRNGSDSYLALLDAQITNSALRREVISTRQLWAEQRIGLYRALAGPLPADPNHVATASAADQQTTMDVTVQ